jgi:hypothetical protein
MDIQKKMMGMVPLNARTFVRNIMRDEDDTSSLITADDLSGPEIEEIYRRIDEQEEYNTSNERQLRELAPALSSRINDWPKTDTGIEQITSGDVFGGVYDFDKKAFIPEEPGAIYGESDLSDEERYKINLDIFNDREQAKLDDTLRKIKSYDDTRGKVSVTDGTGRYSVGGGPLLIEAIKATFTSPAYNIYTTLGGRFNAFKNEDGTVTIKDKYNWTHQKDDTENPSVDMSLGEFILALPIMISRPEAFGNALMRTLFDDKYSNIEFKLPPRPENVTTEVPEGYKDGGRVRLI